MIDQPGRSLRRPGDRRVSAPRSEHIDLVIPPRDVMDATDRFNFDESELYDLPDENLMSTERHFRIPPAP